MENALELRGLVKEYKNFRLGPVDLTLPAGCILGLIGENGAGKTTTLNMILDLAVPTAGEIYVLGRSNRDNFRRTKEDLGVVLDEANFPETFKIGKIESIMSGLYKNWDKEAFESYVNRFGLPKNKKFKEFSKGMKVKLSIAVALSHHAKLLILDEPTSGLDPIVRDEIVEIFYEFTRNQENSILISSHIISDLERLCDYVAFLHKGHLAFCEEKDRLLERYGLFHGGKDELYDLPQEAVRGVRENKYGVDALIEREYAPDVSLSAASIEDIMVYLVKGEKQ